MKDKSHPVTEPEGITDHKTAELLDSADREELEQLREEIARRDKADKDKAELEERIAGSLVINLPPAAGRAIHLAGKAYKHGQTVSVDNNTKWALEEVMRRCWSHEASLHEPEQGRQRKAQHLSGRN
jgi:hypothetical protein